MCACVYWWSIGYTKMKFFKSPAKINLFLRIVHQEPNGYHYLQTLFQFISLQDDIGFELRSDDKIVADYHNEFITEENDLIVKAIRLLQKESGILTGLNITLNKNIPMGAGLGGGSSNAATTLMAVNELYQLDYSSEKLQALGRTLGADVPIFIYGQSAWAEGIGDLFIPMQPKEKSYGLIIPNIAISTQKIFQYPELSRTNPILEQTDHPEYLNDCTSAIYALYPKMQGYMNTLTDLGLSPRITGTGSCIYIDEPTNAQQIYLDQFLKTEQLGYHSFKTLNRSPYHS